MNLIYHMLKNLRKSNTNIITCTHVQGLKVVIRLNFKCLDYLSWYVIISELINLLSMYSRYGNWSSLIIRYAFDKLWKNKLGTEIKFLSFFQNFSNDELCAKLIYVFNVSLKKALVYPHGQICWLSFSCFGNTSCWETLLCL